MGNTLQQIWAELPAMAAQWQGQSVTIVDCWPAAGPQQPPAAFTGQITHVTPAGFLVARTVADPENPGRAAPLTVRVFVAWADLWGPAALTVEGQMRYRTSSGAWRVEPLRTAVARWLRRYQRAVAAAIKEAEQHYGLQSGAPVGGSGRADRPAGAAAPSRHAMDWPLSLP